MILKVPDHCGYEVFDAYGNPLNWVVWADTLTGETVHIVRENNKPIMVTNDAGELVTKTEWTQHPAPLTYKKREAC